MIEAIILDTDKVYSVMVEDEAELDNIAAQWYEIMDASCSTYDENYRRAFRETFDIPIDCDMDEETQAIRDRYGPIPNKNGEFRSKLIQASDLFDSILDAMPVFSEFADNYGLDLVEKVHILDLYG